MPIFKGTTTGSIASSALQIPSTVKSWSLANTDGGSITVTVKIVNGVSGDVVVFQDSIANGHSVLSNIPITILTGYYIIITASASCDYYFSISE